MKTITVCVKNQAEADYLVPQALAEPADLHLLLAVPLEGPLDLWAINDGSWYDAEGATRYNALRGTAWWGGTGDHGLGGGPCLRGVICFGGGKPVHPAWVRSLRDQCLAAGVPFAFLGWGEWVPGDYEAAWHFSKDADTLWPDGTMGAGHYQHNGGPGIFMERLGIADTGRTLDGQTWDQYPEATHGS